MSADTVRRMHAYDTNEIRVIHEITDPNKERYLDSRKPFTPARSCKRTASPANTLGFLGYALPISSISSDSLEIRCAGPDREAYRDDNLVHSQHVPHKISESVA